VRALQDGDGNLSLAALTGRIATSKIWGYGGVVANYAAARAHDGGVGDAPRALFRAYCDATRLPGRRLAGVLAVLPMITPPFVIGLALIMLFAAPGAINAMLDGRSASARRDGFTACPGVQ